MDDHIGVQRQNLFNILRRQNTGQGSAGNVTSISANLIVAIDEQTDQFHLWMVEHRPQAGLAHGPCGPLDDTPLHRLLPNVFPPPSDGFDESLTALVWL